MQRGETELISEGPHVVADPPRRITLRFDVLPVPRHGGEWDLSHTFLTWVIVGVGVLAGRARQFRIIVDLLRQRLHATDRFDCGRERNPRRRLARLLLGLGLRQGLGVLLARRAGLLNCFLQTSVLDANRLQRLLVALCFRVRHPFAKRVYPRLGAETAGPTLHARVPGAPASDGRQLRHRSSRWQGGATPGATSASRRRWRR